LDLAPLQIDRTRRNDAPARRGRGRLRVAPWLLLAAVVVAAWLFHRPLLELVDRVRLPEVEVASPTRPTPLAVVAATGTTASGYVVASTRAALSADTPGRVVEMNVKEGDVVKKGFVVARLFADEYRAAYDRAQADVVAQRRSVDRTQHEVAVAELDVERLQRSAEAAQASVREAAATREQAKLRLDRAEKMVGDDVESRQWLDDARADHARAVAAEEVAQAQLTAANSAVAQARTRVTAQQSAVAESQAHVTVLEAAAALAKATLDKTEVRAPFDGVVVLKDAEVGEVVSPNSQGGNSRGSIATMVDLATLEVQVEMPERSIAAVKVDAPARVFLDARPDHAYAGRVTRIWPVASRAKATIEVRVKFDAPDDQLRPEMGVRVVFLDAAGEQSAATAAAATAPQGVLVPAAAVVRREGATHVFVVESDTVKLVAVVVDEAARSGGAEQSDRVLVSRGLTERDFVVVNPPPRLADGDRVRWRKGGA
jgi:RND family efflux transporter MFP subunit